MFHLRIYVILKDETGGSKKTKKGGGKKEYQRGLLTKF